MGELPWLDPSFPAFPPTENALENPEGLLAAGGNLSPAALQDAYSKGIFPWFSEGEPILWWAPRFRATLLPEKLRISRGSRKQLRNLPFSVTSDSVFEEVIRACAEQRKNSGTWITEEIIGAYIRLHDLGIAHSVEVWEGEVLVGGLYGLKLGSVFCGESMFNLRDSAAKFAFCNLSHRLFSQGFSMIDCQIPNDFLESLGVRVIPRNEFEKTLAAAQASQVSWPSDWSNIDLNEVL